MTCWRNIVTAPRDGTRVLLGKIVGHPDHPTALWWATMGHWSAKWNNWNDGIEPCGLADPTHWMPMDAYGAGGPVARIVDEQAKDEGLWFIAETAAEAYLQQELRRLHAAIEGKSPGECARAALDTQ